MDELRAVSCTCQYLLGRFVYPVLIIFAGSIFHACPCRPPLRKGAARPPRTGIVTASNFVRRWTGGHFAIHLETGPTVLPFGSGRSNRIFMSDLSFTRKRVPSRAKGERWGEGMIRKYRCLLVQSSSKLRRVYDRVSMRSMQGGKKGLLLRELLRFFRSAGEMWKTARSTFYAR